MRHDHGLPVDESRQCVAETKRRRRCKKFPLTTADTCFIHTPEEVAERDRQARHDPRPDARDGLGEVRKNQRQGMTKTAEQRISHTELHLVTVKCKHCQGEIRIDLSNEDQRRTVMHGPVLKCSLCGEDCDPEIILSFKSFGEWYAHLKDCGQEVVFCIEEDS